MGAVAVLLLSFGGGLMHAPEVMALDAAGGTDAASEPVPFDVLEFEVEGNTVLPEIDIERAVYPFLGPGRGLEAVEAAVEALEQAYRNAGYLTVFVDIPEQKVDTGLVKLRVTEGRVERLKVSGTRYYAAGEIRRRLPSLAEGGVPWFPAMQKELGTYNRQPGRSLTPLLRAGRTPGTVEVELRATEQSPFHGGIEVNNRQTPNTTELRIQGSLRYDNLFQRDHSLAVQYQTAPLDRNEVRVISGTYVAPLPKSGHILAVYAVRSRSDIAAVGDIRVAGNANIFGARYIVPVRGTERFNHSVTFGLDRKDFGESVTLVGADTLNNPISYSPLSLGYAASVNGAKGVTRAGVTATSVPRGFLGNDGREFALKRFRATANFLAVRADVSREQRIAGDASWFLRLGGQLASGPLIATEGYFAGGFDSVRGYLESERVGDNGVFGSIELRTPNYGSEESPRLQDLTGFAFVDAAQLRLLDPLPSQVARFDLLGTGAGLKVRAWKALNAQAVVAVPLEDAFMTRRNQPRVHFRVAYDF